MKATRKKIFLYEGTQIQKAKYGILALKKVIIKQQSMDPEQSGKEGCSRVHSRTFLSEKGKK